MKKTISLFLALALMLSVVLAGCGGNNMQQQLTGRWERERNNTTEILELWSDGTGIYIGSINVRWSTEGSRLKINQDNGYSKIGDYSISGGVLTYNYQRIGSGNETYTEIWNKVD
ncbi:MAG: hypothetical protein FWH04_02720 [Oscillospiraceae bacterium]|nr:hypothetical protein [Oscillospiraceae bacterium]